MNDLDDALADLDEWIRRAEDAEWDASRAWKECHGYETRINATRSLHQADAGECPTCSDDRGPLRSPCPTLRALDGDA